MMCEDLPAKHQPSSAHLVSSLVALAVLAVAVAIFCHLYM